MSVVDFLVNIMDDNNNNVKDEQTIIIRKWKCEECTYDNWPSATKCTLCRNINRKQQYKLTKSTSPPVVVCQNSPIARTPTNQIQLQPTTKDQDIYRLANIIINEDEQQQQQQESDNTNGADSNRKWNCPICTYLNWPKSKKCVQCYTQRCSRRSSPRQNSPRSCPQSPCTIPKRVNDVQAHTSPTPPVDLVLLAQPEEQATMTNMLKKWTCSVCTYENWPKSVKCVMCKLNRQSQQQPTVTNNNNKRILLASSQNAVFTTSSGNDIDRLFLLACQGIVDNNLTHLGNYINSGGDITRYLTNEEVKLLKRPQTFFTGLTLIHLCYQYNHTEYLMKFINNKFYQKSQQQRPKKVFLHKYLPCQSCPLLALNIIERYFSANLRQRNLTGQQLASYNTPCFYVNDCHVFVLPSEIECGFQSHIKNIILDEFLDRDVQYELESSESGRIINWNLDLLTRLSSYLYPLWNRHSGDCLLDSVLQACYGVFDTDNILRNVMAQCLDQLDVFKQRWKEHELIMAQSLNYTIDDIQLEHDWNNLIMLAQQPGSSLEQAHIFALCHIFRRPIIVYSVKYVKSYKGENIGYSHFEGVYLPLLWESNFCFKNPIVLGYTRGHFTALVHMERSYINPMSTNPTNASGNSSQMNANNSTPSCAPSLTTSVNSNSSSTNDSDNHLYCGAIVNDLNENCASGNGSTMNVDSTEQTFYLPLTNSDGQLLPIHFLTESEIGKERILLRQYFHLDCLISPSSNCGLLVAQLKVPSKRPMLVKQMLDEWLVYYREMQLKENQKPSIIEDVNDDDDDDDDDDEDEDDDEEEEDDDNGVECVVDVES